MESKEIKIKNLSESRFGLVILLFRLGGIPFKMNEISTIYAIYMNILIICGGTTYLGMFVDVYIHRNELGRAMTNVRMLITITNIVWIYTYCRYVRTLAVTVTATHIEQIQYIFSNYNNKNKYIREGMTSRGRGLFQTSIL